MKDRKGALRTTQDISDGFKMTELGPLPEEWEVVRLGNILEPDRVKVKREHYNGTVPIIEKIPFNIGHIIFRNKRETRTDLYIAGESRLVTSKINFHQGAVAITRKTTGATTHYEFYKTLEKADIDYLWWYFRSREFKNLFAQEIKFRGFKKEANYKFLKNFKIPLPPLPEQKKIAAVLSAVQEAKEKTEAVIEAAKELKKSLMKHLFTYGPVSAEEAEKVKLKETEIGLIPEDWEATELRNVCSLRKETCEPKGAEDNVYVGLEHILPGQLRIDNWGKPSEVRSTKNIFRHCDILYGKLRPYLDKIAVAHLDGICSTDILVLQVNQEKTTETFLANYMHTKPFLEYATTTMSGVNHPRTSWTKLNSFKVPLPPSPVQQKMAETLSAVDEKIQAEENKKKALEELFKTLLNDLMTAKIRVNNLEVPA